MDGGNEAANILPRIQFKMSLKTEDLLNNQINLEYTAMYTYEAMVRHSRNQVNWNKLHEIFQMLNQAPQFTNFSDICRKDPVFAFVKPGLKCPPVVYAGELPLLAMSVQGIWRILGNITLVKKPKRESNDMHMRIAHMHISVQTFNHGSTLSSDASTTVGKAENPFLFTFRCTVAKTFGPALRMAFGASCGPTTVLP